MPTLHGVKIKEVQTDREGVQICFAFAKGALGACPEPYQPAARIVANTALERVPILSAREVARARKTAQQVTG